MNQDDHIYRAFMDELTKIAAAHGGTLPGLEKVAILGGGANPFKGGPGLFQRFGQDLP